MPIYDAAMQYQTRGRAADRHRRQGVRHRQLARLGGEGHALLGVRAVIAESFERIHRSNLVGMGVLPLQFLPGETRETLGLPATRPSPSAASRTLTPQCKLDVEATGADGSVAALRPSPPASIRRSRSTTTATAASCRP